MLAYKIWIALVSCDSNTTSSPNYTDRFTYAQSAGAVAALLYSSYSQACLIKPAYADLAIFNQCMGMYVTRFLLNLSTLAHAVPAVSLRNPSTPLRKPTLLLLLKRYFKADSPSLKKYQFGQLGPKNESTIRQLQRIAERIGCNCQRDFQNRPPTTYKSLVAYLPHTAYNGR